MLDFVEDVNTWILGPPSEVWETLLRKTSLNSINACPICFEQQDALKCGAFAHLFHFQM